MKIKENKFFLLLLLILGLFGGLLMVYSPSPGGAFSMVSFTGETMGTTYEVQIAGVELDDAALLRLKRLVDAELLAVNEAMSTYMPESEISRFNRSGPGVPLPVGIRFREVLERSFEIFRLTQGAFDPTLGPLIDLWGFGAMGPQVAGPSEVEIQVVLQRVGMGLIRLSAEGLRKELAGVEINLSAIAKGYGVDRVADLLLAEGYENLYVEVGGELRCKGVNGTGIPWRIGIQVPEPGAASRATKVLGLDHKALATSGDYRNYVADESGLRHHILDPRTGRPATHTLASVSVMADDCMTADAVATALFVMGTDEGMAWVGQQEGIEALFIDREGEGHHRITATPGFQDALIALP